MVKKRVKLPQPVPIGEMLFQYLEKLGGSREKSRIASLWSNWNAVMGAEIGDCVEEINEKGNTLLLKVADAMIMQEMGFHKEEIREKANAFLGSSYFDSVRFTL